MTRDLKSLFFGGGPVTAAVRQKEIQMMQVLFLFLAMFVVTGVASGQDDKGKQDQPLDPDTKKILQQLEELQPPEWNYADLASKSDLIVIAKAISRSEIEWDKALGGDFDDGSTTKLMTNRLKVLSVLKGQAGQQINVMTLEWKPNVLFATNFDFAELRPKLLRPVVVSTVVDGEIIGFAEIVNGNKTHTIEPEYLLYLRRVEGEKYIPVTGQRYSGMSVRRLND